MPTGKTLIGHYKSLIESPVCSRIVCSVPFGKSLLCNGTIARRLLAGCCRIWWLPLTRLRINPLRLRAAIMRCGVIVLGMNSLLHRRKLHFRISQIGLRVLGQLFSIREHIFQIKRYCFLRHFLGFRKILTVCYASWQSGHKHSKTALGLWTKDYIEINFFRKLLCHSTLILYHEPGKSTHVIFTTAGTILYLPGGIQRRHCPFEALAKKGKEYIQN